MPYSQKAKIENAEKITCACGRIVSRGALSRHLESNLHLGISRNIIEDNENQQYRYRNIDNCIYIKVSWKSKRTKEQALELMRTKSFIL